MRRKLILFTILFLVLAAVTAGLSVFTVDRTEYVYLTQFGRRVAVYDGADDAQAGLHFRLPWPVQSALRLDRRLQYFDLPGTELLTRDIKKNTIDKTLTIDAYVCWRIAGDGDGGDMRVDSFIRTMGTVEHANSVLGQRLTSDLGAAVGKMELDDLISTEEIPAGDGTSERKVDRKREELRAALLDGDDRLRDTARRDWGIDIVDVRLRRTNHPPAVRQAIFDRIMSEREKKSADYRSQGEQQAADIKSASDRKVAELRTEAEAESVRLRGRADAEADHIRSDAARQDPEFYSFLNKLEDYKRFLGDNKTMLLLSTRGSLFDTLFKPPNPSAAPAKPGPPAASAAPMTDKGVAP